MMIKGIRYAQQYLAIRRLNKLVRRAKAAPATIEYARRRDAAKLGWARRKGAVA